MTQSDANADEIGRAKIGGKTVIIDSDGTWKYSDDKPINSGDCKVDALLVSRKVPVSFCANQPWAVRPQNNDIFEYQLSNASAGAFAGLITEKTQISEEFAEQAILTLAARASNKTVADIPVKKRTQILIDGKQWHYIEYMVNVKGSDFTFGDYYKGLGSDGFVQLLVWSSSNQFEENRLGFEEMASGLRIN